MAQLTEGAEMEMNRLERAALLSWLVVQLRSRGSWSGETHLQKAAFLLQEAAQVPLGYRFVLYKHGPFSFDLREDLNDFNGDGLIVIEPQPYPYGPKLAVTSRAEKNMQLREETIKRYREPVGAVVDFVGSKGVTWLERTATAYLLHIADPEASDEQIADQLVEVKPHVGRFDALTAVREMRGALSSLVTP